MAFKSHSCEHYKMVKKAHLLSPGCTVKCQSSRSQRRAEQARRQVGAGTEKGVVPRWALR
jgi:hypothetical protein